MKAFIVALCIIGAVSAHKGGEKGGERGGHGGHHKKEKYWNATGCEDYNITEKVTARTCCPALPHTFGKVAWEECEKECKDNGNRGCCKVNCVLKKRDLLDDAQKFSSEKGKAFLLKLVNGSTAWNTDALVDSCVKAGPDMVKKRQEEQAMSGRKEKKECEYQENIEIAKCIRRGLHINCQVWDTNEDCTRLKKFADSCEKYPAPGPCEKGKRQEGGPKKEEGKGGPKKEDQKKDPKKDGKKNDSKKDDKKKDEKKKN